MAELEGLSGICNELLQTVIGVVHGMHAHVFNNAPKIMWGEETFKSLCVPLSLSHSSDGPIEQWTIPHPQIRPSQPQVGLEDVESPVIK